MTSDFDLKRATLRIFRFCSVAEAEAVCPGESLFVGIPFYSKCGGNAFIFTGFSGTKRSESGSEGGWLASFSNSVIEQFSFSENSENCSITRFENEASQPDSERLSESGGRKLIPMTILILIFDYIDRSFRSEDNF